MNRISYTIIRATVLATVPIAAASYAQEVNYPTSTVKIIVPFSAGGASDVLTRQLADNLRAKLGQNWVVENRTGAGGNIGMEAVKNASPDGHTISSATIGTLSINQFLFSNLSYNPATDFVYVSKIWENCNAFVVSPTHPANNIKEFLDWAKAKPNGVTFGSAGVGTTPHLAGELFRVRTGIKATHIPYRGAAQSMPALMSGETDFAIDNIASYTPLIQTGRVKALAVTCPKRWPTMPNVPIMSEVGVPDFVVTSWGAFVLPKGTPTAIANKLSNAIKEIANEPAVKERFLTTGALSVSSTPAETAAFAESERTKWREVVRLSGAKLD